MRDTLERFCLLIAMSLNFAIQVIHVRFEGIIKLAEADVLVEIFRELRFLVEQNGLC